MKTHRPDEVMAGHGGETETPEMDSGSGGFHLPDCQRDRGMPPDTVDASAGSSGGRAPETHPGRMELQLEPLVAEPQLGPLAAEPQLDAASLLEALEAAIREALEEANGLLLACVEGLEDEDPARQDIVDALALLTMTTALPDLAEAGKCLRSARDAEACRTVIPRPRLGDLKRALQLQRDVMILRIQERMPRELTEGDRERFVGILREAIQASNVLYPRRAMTEADVDTEISRCMTGYVRVAEAHFKKVNISTFQSKTKTDRAARSIPPRQRNGRLRGPWHVPAAPGPHYGALVQIMWEMAGPYYYEDYDDYDDTPWEVPPAYGPEPCQDDVPPSEHSPAQLYAYGIPGPLEPMYVWPSLSLRMAAAPEAVDEVAGTVLELMTEPR